MSNHDQYYKILGISQDATSDEIKNRYRQLCKQYHPDIVGNHDKNNLEYFQRINHAADVLTDPIKRKQYDMNQQQNQSYHATNNPFQQSFYDPYRIRRNGNRASSSSSSQQHIHGGFHHMLEIVFRPRNFFVIGPVTLMSAVTLLQWLMPSHHKNNSLTHRHHHDHDKEHKIQAWMNPITNQFETPAPWDPIYQQMKPTLEYIPRDQVKTRTR